MKIFDRDDDLIFECKRQSAKKTVKKALELGVDLSHANLSGMDLSYMDFSYANFSYANLRNANLHGTNLRESNLIYADLKNANLSGAYLVYADLDNADLRGANLFGTDLRHTHMRYVKLYNANLLETAVLDANLWGDKIKKIPMYICAGFGYEIWITDTKIRIENRIYTTAEWENATDGVFAWIAGQDIVEFWHKYKDVIIAMAKEHQREE